MRTLGRLGLLAGLVLILQGSLLGQSFPTETYRKSAKDTTVVKAFQTIVHAIVVENAGSADTLSIWNTTATGTMTETVRIFKAVAWSKGTYTFGPNGLWLTSGMTVSIAGTTAGHYVIIYE